MVFLPTRSRAVVYANDGNPDSRFTGPKQKARYLRAHDLIELTDSNPDQYHRDDQVRRDELDRKQTERTEHVFQEALQELGDAGTFTSDPGNQKANQETHIEVSNHKPGGDDKASSSPPMVDGE